MEYMVTMQPDQRLGVRMKTDLYHSIKDHMLKVLESNDGVSSEYFFSILHREFAERLGDNTGWYLYQVKLDMEVRGLIRIEKPKKRGSGKRLIKIFKKKTKGRVKKKMEVTFIKPTATSSSNVKLKFIELYKNEPLIVHSPGRINLLGEHTDYNNGFVMPAAIDKGIQVAIARSEHENSLLYSLKYDEFFSFNLASLGKVQSPEWANYFLGILYQLECRGFKIPNFNCAFDGDLPTGAGLSSSAALECGFVYALNSLFDLKLLDLDMIHIAQWSEHNYVGVKCGIMDQYTSIMGKKNHAMVLDCQWLKHEYFSINLGKYSLLLCDTNVKHSLASSEYNTRRQECEQGVVILKTRYPEIKSLRDVSLGMLLKHKREFDPIVYKRCAYVIRENRRVLKASEDLKKGKLAAFGRKMFETHDGLSTQYEVSCPELDFLVDQAKGYGPVLGARMMGGGFGGCTLNIILESAIESFLQTLKVSYRSRFGIEMSSHMVKIGDGTSIID